MTMADKTCDTCRYFLQDGELNIPCVTNHQFFGPRYAGDQACEKYEPKVCGTCKHFIGGGDWNLCCDQMYELCYSHTQACGKYDYSPETEKRVTELERRVMEYVREAKGQ